MWSRTDERAAIRKRAHAQAQKDALGNRLGARPTVFQRSMDMVLKTTEDRPRVAESGRSQYRSSVMK
jgi:hypothetical protein